MFMTSVSGAVRKGMTSLYLNSSVEWMRKKNSECSAAVHHVHLWQEVGTCRLGEMPQGWSQTAGTSVTRAEGHSQHLIPALLPQGGVCQSVCVCGREYEDVLQEGRGWRRSNPRGQNSTLSNLNYRTIPTSLESDPSGVCFPLRLPLLIFNNQSKSLTQIHCGWMTPCPPWKVQKGVKIRGEWEVLEQKREPWEVPSNGKSPGERIKCFRMLQVLNGASNLPPDAFQSHKHTLHAYTQLPDIIRERGARERGARESGSQWETDGVREKE